MCNKLTTMSEKYDELHKILLISILFVSCIDFVGLSKVDIICQHILKWVWLTYYFFHYNTIIFCCIGRSSQIQPKGLHIKSHL